MSLVLPNKFSLSQKLSDYFWQHAIHHKDEEDSGLWIDSLNWMDPEQEYDSIHEIRTSRAWSETMEILSNQHVHPTTGLCLSYSAPVVVPVAILSTLHLLDSLRIQFDRLVNMMTSPHTETLDTAFLDIMMLTESTSESEDDQQRLIHWLAAVGATVEALWKNEDASQWASTLIQRVPRSVTCRASTVTQKSNLNQLDEITKKAMIHILVGSILLKDKDSERQKQGLIELENSEVLRSAIRKLQKSRTEEQEGDLESIVMSFAEFVVSFVGLGSWMESMKLKELSNEKEILIQEQIREVSLTLRRMIRHPVLLENQQSIVDRLARLSRFMAHHPGDADSACDLSEEDDQEEEVCVKEEEQHLTHHQILIKRADKAQLILHDLT
jgi:Arc/MetJ-type ribon-helix-helix transcriptional regulator